MLADLAQTVDGMVAESRPNMTRSAQSLAALMARLDDRRAPADHLPSGYDHIAGLLDGLAASARATAAIARLRNAMAARGWL